MDATGKKRAGGGRMYPVIPGGAMTAGIQLMFWTFTVIVTVVSFMMAARSH